MSSANDLISRQAAIDALKEKRDSAKEWYEEASASGDEMILARAESAIMTFVECLLTIKKLSSTQPEIVRCKDCANYDTDWTPETVPDRHYCLVMDGMMPKDGFCNFAERRNDEAD